MKSSIERLSIEKEELLKREKTKLKEEQSKYRRLAAELAALKGKQF